jgi:hypothetical protein
MPISFKCPLCRERVQVSRRDAATTRPCPACAGTIEVPALKKTPEVEIDERSGGETAEKEELIRRFGAMLAKDETMEVPLNPVEDVAPLKRAPISSSRVKAAKPPTPSKGKLEAAEKAAESDRTRFAVAIAAGVSLIFIGVAVLALTWPKPPPAPTVRDVAAATTSAPVVATVTPLPQKDPALELALDAIADARALEKQGKEIDSESALEEALERTKSPEARRALVAARRALLERGRERLAEVMERAKKLALAGKFQEGQTAIFDLVAHIPVALRPDLEREVGKLNDELFAQQPKRAKNVQVRYPAPAHPQAEHASDEPARFAKLEIALDDALQRLDAGAVDRALAEAGEMKDPEHVSGRDFESFVVKAAIETARAALAALAKDVGTEVELALWKGAPASGTLLGIERDTLTLRLAEGGRREIDLNEISERSLGAVLYSRASEERAQLGLGVLALVHDDLPAALAHFQKAPSLEQAVAYARWLDEKGVKPLAAAPKPVEKAKPKDPDADAPASGDITDSWPNGRPKRRYSHDGKGRLTGVCIDFYPNGKTAKKSTYARGKLHGEVFAYDESGKQTFHGTYFEDQLLYTRSKDEILAALAAIDAASVKTPARPASASEFAPLDWDAQARALKRLRAYRWLCGVEPDVELSWTYAEKTTAAAKLLEYVGHLEHKPAKPAGCPDRIYEVGFDGTSHSNLDMNTGGVTALASVDDYMFDSDDSNRDRVGHRRWCLNPTMRATAFGVDKSYAAMWSFDMERNAPTPDHVCYPAAGYFPSSFVRRGDRPRLAWSVSLDPARSKPVATSALTITVTPADESFRKLEPVSIEYANVSDFRSATPLCVIFQPRCSLEPGQRYFVSIKGLVDQDGKSVPLDYFVEFF